MTDNKVNVNAVLNADCIGLRIHMLRQEKGLTLQELGDLVGVGASTIRKWETGMIKSIKSYNMSKLTEVFGVTPAYIMGWTDDRQQGLPGSYDRVKQVDELQEQLKGLHNINTQAMQKYLLKIMSQINASIASTNSSNKEEDELLAIYRKLGARDRIKLLNFAIELEENCQPEGETE